MASITLVLDDNEQQALNQLLDTALRQAGLHALDVVSHFAGRIFAAQSATAQPQVGNPTPVQAKPAVPAQAKPAVVAQQAPHSAAAHSDPNAPAQHQSILSHLIGEIAGSGQTQPVTHPAASAGTAPAATTVPAASKADAPSQPVAAHQTPAQTTQSVAASTPAATPQAAS